MAISRAELIEHVLVDFEAASARVAAHAAAEVPAYRTLDSDTVVTMTENALRILLSALQRRANLTERDRQSLRSYGQTRARQGISLEDVYRAWRVAVREILDALSEAGDDDPMVLRLTRELLDHVDDAILAYSSGHRDAELERARSDELRRGEFIRGLLTGSLGPNEIHLGAEQYGIDLERQYCAFHAHPLSEDSADRLEDRLRLATPTNCAFVTTLNGDLSGFVAASTNYEIDVTVGFGPPERLHHLDRSFRLATRALTTARALRLTGGQDFDRLGLTLAVTADPDIGDELHRRYIAPLGDGESAQVLLDTVRCYFELGTRVDATADALVVHPNTVRYRIARFEELTKADLRKPHSALQTWWAIQHTRIRPDAKTVR